MNPIIQDAVFGAVQQQSWFKKNANTIVAGVGALAALLSFVATLPIPMEDQYKGIIPAVVAVLTAFAIKATKNGVQPSMADDLAKAAPVVQQQVELATVRAAIDRSTPPAVEQVDLAAAESQRWAGDSLGQAQGAANYSHQLEAEPSGRHSRVE